MILVLIFVLYLNQCYVILDVVKPVGELLHDYGYSHEKYDIFTEDEYILELERIPGRINVPTIRKGHPVLLVHGLVGACTDWIILGPKKALALLLADEGYDVWILNCRGTHMYTRHKRYEIFGPTMRHFWDFSFHEIGVYDLPPTIDFILNTTKMDKLNYIGHSQGTTAFFILICEKPEYNSKITALIGYAPSVFMCHSGPWTHRVPGTLEKLSLLSMGRGTIGDLNVGMKYPLVQEFCVSGFYTAQVCKVIISEIVNTTPSELTDDIIPLVFTYYPAGASTKQLVHYVQFQQNCVFRHFQTSVFDSPKDYDLKNFHVPVYAFSAQEDNIQRPEDTVITGNKIGGYKEFHLIPGLAHADLVLGKSAPTLIYPTTFRILEDIERENEIKNKTSNENNFNNTKSNLDKPENDENNVTMKNLEAQEGYSEKNLLPKNISSEEIGDEKVDNITELSNKHNETDNTNKISLRINKTKRINNQTKPNKTTEVKYNTNKQDKTSNLTLSKKNKQEN